MATHDKQGTGGKFELTRRDFLKAGAAAAVVGAAGADLVFTPSRADAADVAATYTSTCPYCSAQCGQKVDVAADGTVLDIYGDPNSPTSRGGLCSKGAGSYQLVTNPRRLGVPEHTAAVDGYDFTGQAWKRIGNGSWTAITLDTAMSEIATQLKSIRGDLSQQKSVYSLLEVPSGSTTVKVEGVDYYGFTNLGVVKAGTGMYYVGTGGVKVDKTTFRSYVEGLPGTAAQLVGAIDDLVWRASSPADKASWKFLGRSDLKAKVFARDKFPDSIDVVYDGGIFYAYVATLDLDTLVFTSTDMLTWTYTGSIGRPGSYGLVNPSVIKSGSTLKVWHNRLTGPGAYDYKVYYSEYDGTSWTTVSLPVNHGGSQLTMCGHPHVRIDEYDATKYVMTYNTSAGIYEASAATSSPTAFSAGTLLHDGSGVIEAAVQAGRAGNRYGLFTEYASGTGYPHEYAFAKVRAYAYTNNANSVMFFGSSHLNNEANYLYRKIIANFGTSNIEHQARI